MRLRQPSSASARPWSSPQGRQPAAPCHSPPQSVPELPWSLPGRGPATLLAPYMPVTHIHLLPWACWTKEETISPLSSSLALGGHLEAVPLPCLLTESEVAESGGQASHSAGCLGTPRTHRASRIVRVKYRRYLNMDIESCNFRISSSLYLKSARAKRKMTCGRDRGL